ncbi:MAG TPA: nitronate monooxygenase [Candidatus Cybelea sp.]|nr:nitronate monooxygenase [Candidatus Cybelea sp.]
MTVYEDIRRRMALPVIAAPMFLVSNPTMALAACGAGVIGSFPAHTTRTGEDLEAWLVQMAEGLRRLEGELGRDNVAPYAVNLVVHATNARMAGDLERVIRHKVPIVLTSKGAPGDVFKRVHDYGGFILHDVASRRHAEKAIEAGADGLIAVAGGAGGHCGTINPFALMNEIRQVFAGPIVLAGSITTGRDVLAAEVLGADLVYMGTRFINTEESSAPPAYRQMICDSSATDIFFTRAVDGAPANFLTFSLNRAGIDLEELAAMRPGSIISAQESKKRWKDIWSAGQGVGSVNDVLPVRELCARLKREYAEARRGLVRLVG